MKRLVSRLWRGLGGGALAFLTILAVVHPAYAIYTNNNLPASHIPYNFTHPYPAGVCPPDDTACKSGPQPPPAQPFDGRCTSHDGHDNEAAQGGYISTHEADESDFTHTSKSVPAGTKTVDLNIVLFDSLCKRLSPGVTDTWYRVPSVSADGGATISGFSRSIFKVGYPSTPYDANPNTGSPADLVSVYAYPIRVHLPALDVGDYTFHIMLENKSSINRFSNGAYYCVESGGQKFPDQYDPAWDDFNGCHEDVTGLPFTIHVAAPALVSCEVLSMSPNPLQPGDSFTAEFRVTNDPTSGEALDVTNHWRLGANGSDYHPHHRNYMAQGDGYVRADWPGGAINPGESRTFDVNFQAKQPSGGGEHTGPDGLYGSDLSPGDYPFEWQVVQEGVGWFGGICSGTLSVEEPPRLPYLTVLGGEVFAGSNLSTNVDSSACTTLSSSSQVKGQQPDADSGSRGQFGVGATADINQFGSNALVNGDEATFGNRPTSGNFYRTICRPDFTKLATSRTLFGDNHSISDFTSLGNNIVIKWSGSGNKILSGGTLGPGQRITIINLAGTVRITGDIHYVSGGTDNPNYGDVNDIPAFQLASVEDILIDPSVSTLTGYYTSNAALSTCSDNPVDVFKPNILTDAGGTACGNPLHIYGAIAADTFYFRRTSGDAKSSNGTFNNDLNHSADLVLMTPEMFLASPPGLSGGGLRTFLGDLPPVF